MIEGKLVNLRAREMGDLERNYRWMNDREVTEYLGARTRYPISLTAEEVWLREGSTPPMSFGNVFFAIEKKGRRAHRQHQFPGDVR